MRSLWPESGQSLNLPLPGRSGRCLKNGILKICKENQLVPGFSSTVEEVYLPLAAWIAQKRSEKEEGSTTIGINGAQGSGKSTLCRFLEFLLLELWQIRSITISIDDLYKTREQRKYLAATVHPLFQTRGVPGTHDVELGLKLFRELKNMKPDSDPVAIPRFNKASDDRYPQSQWSICTQAPEVILFEGWCVGAVHQPAGDLETPVNRMERERDSRGLWREHVNSQLAKLYPALFNQIDHLIMLKVPGMEEVIRWRKQQEHSLADSLKNSQEGNRIMTDLEIEEFVMHYQRLTQYMLKEMPQRADVLLWLDGEHQIYRITV